MKRKLKDLKENECIKVNTLKEAEFLLLNNPVSYITHDRIIPALIKGKYVRITNDGLRGFCWTTEPEEGQTVVKGSDFVKSKKSKLKKRLKEAEKELARFDNRLAELESQITIPKSNTVKESVSVEVTSFQDIENKYAHIDKLIKESKSEIDRMHAGLTNYDSDRFKTQLKAIVAIKNILAR